MRKQFEFGSDSVHQIMNQHAPAFPYRQDYEAKLRSQLASLRARYDGGAVSPSMYTVIVDLETEIAWLEHQRARRTP